MGSVFGEVFEAFDRPEAESAQDGERGVAERREQLRCVAGSGAAGIFAAGDVAHPVQAVLDPPVVAGQPQPRAAGALSRGRLVIA